MAPASAADALSEALRAAGRSLRAVARAMDDMGAKLPAELVVAAACAIDATIAVSAETPATASSRRRRRRRRRITAQSLWSPPSNFDRLDAEAVESFDIASLAPTYAAEPLFCNLLDGDDLSVIHYFDEVTESAHAVSFDISTAASLALGSSGGRCDGGCASEDQHAGSLVF